MAEPPPPTPVTAASLDRDALLATKLHVPHPPPGLVPRPRLAERLDAGLRRGLILVCAPAGFGKTSLLADWARRDRRPLAWLSLDAGDNDPVRLWRHLVAALERVRPGLVERVAPLLDSPAPPSLDGLATVLINELAASAGEALLVLDDYHLIEAQQAHASLAFLIEHRPPGLRLVVASRVDPPLPLPRLRARGQLAELRATELAFTIEEAAALLRATAGGDLPQAAAATLTARTEGWAAGLQLAGLSLRGQRDIAAFVTTFSGSHRHILDYLTEEVLERQPGDVRAFLLETSVLDRLSGAVCDAVTGRDDGQAMLERVERANLFLMPLDEVRGWWRYHQLFAELLRARLRRWRPDRVATLHRAAADWCARHGLVDEAIRHALEAKDAEWAARLAERHADALLMRSEGATVRRWLATLPTELVAARPRLLLAQARLALLGGRVAQAEMSLAAAERAPAAVSSEEPYQPSVGRGMSLLANVPATIALDRAYLAELRGDADAALAHIAHARDALGDDEWMLRTHLDGYLGVAEWLRGRLVPAERALTSTIAQWRAAGERHLAVRGCHHLGQVRRALGRLDAALDAYRQALEVAAPPGQPPLPAAGIAYVGMAEVAYQRDDLDAALRHVTEGIALSRQLVYAQPLASGLAILAGIRQAQGDPAGARQALDEAERVSPSTGVTTLLNPVPALRARLLLVQGDLAAAVRWTRERGLDADDEPCYAQEPDHLVLARVLLAQSHPQQALALLERLLVAATAQHRLGSMIEIQALRARALASDGDEPAALTAMADAITLAGPHGHVRVFVDEGAPLAALLTRLATDRDAAVGIPQDRLARLSRAFGGSRAAPSPGASAVAALPGLVEPLTPRELEVLRRLAAGQTNRRIADELVVTLDTVKKHVSHILDKLGAANRTEAVARGRALGLLP